MESACGGRYFIFLDRIDRMVLGVKAARGGRNVKCVKKRIMTVDFTDLRGFWGGI